uniref:Uncharacterized protein n=1 Tax=Rhizophora mucronata TaxID=61149 RepID=A0A2P2IJ45_RHIMU
MDKKFLIFKFHFVFNLFNCRL